MGYALDTPGYYARMIKDLMRRWGKNKRAIAEIFVQRMEMDLSVIERKWKIDNCGDGKSLKDVVLSKAGKAKAGYFLVKMLENSARYKGVNDDNAERTNNKVMRMFTGH